MKDYNDICYRTTSFLKKFFRIYLEDRNFSQVIDMLHQEISWIGTGAHEICHNYEDAIRLLDAERDSWDGKFRILEEWYQPLPMNESTCAIFGRLKICEEGLRTILIDMDSRFSAICMLEDGSLKIYHIHFSVPNSFQKENEFVHKKVVDDYNLLLEEKLLERTHQLKEREKALRLSQKRYEIALHSSELAMFEYDILTKELTLYDNAGSLYNIPNVLKNGMESFINLGIIEPDSVIFYREMYQKIHEGQPFASCQVNVKDADGNIHRFELNMTTIYDDYDKPVRAIGVRKNMSMIQQLEKEREYGKTLVSNKVFLFEADVTSDTILFWDEKWGKKAGAAKDIPFSKVFNSNAAYDISPEHYELIINSCSKKNIMEQYEKGNTLITFPYRRKTDTGEWHWHEATINIIKDQQIDHFYIRFYNVDVNDRKIKESKALEEQRLYESMISRAIVAYEINITKNLVISGHEYWNKEYGIEISDEYSKMIVAFVENVTHCEDSMKFARIFNRNNVLSTFHSGKRQISCQYRKKLKSGDYQWVICNMHLYEDPVNGDIKGFAYVEDIDKQKRAELALKYEAEHDKMTGLYNKATTEALICEFLETHSSKLNCHAFIMMDVDYFKYINDNFGHPFGDVVLAEVAEKIRSTFRHQDIVGRIGGDEFCVFMKNVHSDTVVRVKVNEVCAKIMHTYIQDGIAATISISAGIAMCNVAGDDYHSLYRRADEALYTAKRSGRNQYAI